MGHPAPACPARRRRLLPATGPLGRGARLPAPRRRRGAGHAAVLADAVPGVGGAHAGAPAQAGTLPEYHQRGCAAAEGLGHRPVCGLSGGGAAGAEHRQHGAAHHRADRWVGGGWAAGWQNCEQACKLGMGTPLHGLVCCCPAPAARLPSSTLFAALPVAAAGLLAVTQCNASRIDLWGTNWFDPW